MPERAPPQQDAARVRDRFGHVLHGIGRQAAQDKPRAFADELMRDRLADSGAGSGNDRNFVL